MIKTLLASLREYKKPAIMTPILVAMEVMMETLIPTIMASIIDNGIMTKNMDNILHYGLILLAMAMVSLFCGWANGVTAAKASTGFAKNLRHDMYYKIQDYSFENIDKFSVSSLVTRMTTDIMNVQMAFMMIIRVAIRCPLMLVFSFAMGFIMGGRLAMIFLFTIPFLAIGLALVIRAAMPVFRRVFRKYDALNDSVQENVQAMRVVKSYVREDYEKKKFAAAAENDAVLRLHGNGIRFVLRLLRGYHQPGPGSERGTDDRDGYLQLPDPHEPDDGFHGFRYDHHVAGIDGAYY